MGSNSDFHPGFLAKEEPMSRSCLCPLGSSDCQEGAAQTPFAAGFLQPLSCSGSHRSSAAPSGALQMCSGFLYFPASFSTSPFQALWSSPPSCTSSFPVHGVLAGISRELAWAQGETCGGPDCLQTLLQPRHSHRGLREGTWGPHRSPQCSEGVHWELPPAYTMRGCCPSAPQC